MDGIWREDACADGYILPPPFLYPPPIPQYLDMPFFSRTAPVQTPPPNRPVIIVDPEVAARHRRPPPPLWKRTLRRLVSQDRPAPPPGAPTETAAQHSESPAPEAPSCENRESPALRRWSLAGVRKSFSREHAAARRASIASGQHGGSGASSERPEIVMTKVERIGPNDTNTPTRSHQVGLAQSALEGKREDADAGEEGGAAGHAETGDAGARNAAAAGSEAVGTGGGDAGGEDVGAADGGKTEDAAYDGPGSAGECSAAGEGDGGEGGERAEGTPDEACRCASHSAADATTWAVPPSIAEDDGKKSESDGELRAAPPVFQASGGLCLGEPLIPPAPIAELQMDGSNLSDVEQALSSGAPTESYKRPFLDAGEPAIEERRRRRQAPPGLSTALRYSNPPMRPYLSRHDKLPGDYDVPPVENRAGVLKGRKQLRDADVVPNCLQRLETILYLQRVLDSEDRYLYGVTLRAKDFKAMVPKRALEKWAENTARIGLSMGALADYDSPEELLDRCIFLVKEAHADAAERRRKHPLAPPQPRKRPRSMEKYWAEKSARKVCPKPMPALFRGTVPFNIDAVFALRTVLDVLVELYYKLLAWFEPAVLMRFRAEYLPRSKLARVTAEHQRISKNGGVIPWVNIATMEGEIEAAITEVLEGNEEVAHVAIVPPLRARARFIRHDVKPAPNAPTILEALAARRALEEARLLEPCRLPQPGEPIVPTWDSQEDQGPEDDDDADDDDDEPDNDETVPYEEDMVTHEELLLMVYGIDKQLRKFVECIVKDISFVARRMHKAEMEKWDSFLSRDEFDWSTLTGPLDSPVTPPPPPEEMRDGTGDTGTAQPVESDGPSAETRTDPVDGTEEEGRKSRFESENEDEEAHGDTMDAGVPSLPPRPSRVLRVQSTKRRGMSRVMANRLGFVSVLVRRANDARRDSMTEMQRWLGIGRDTDVPEGPKDLKESFPIIQKQLRRESAQIASEERAQVRRRLQDRRLRGPFGRLLRRSASRG
ncbi:hypothetical protein MSPP1_002164 [Malassezia sp. CBS 17886]|nr:hypothetical protein MSPP1_002164 [Malassezia sp. CBS 17886]